MAVAKKGIQIKFLKEYLQRLSNEKCVFGWRDTTIDEVVEPKHVIEAKKRIEHDVAIVHAFDKRVEEYKKEISEKKKIAYRQCEREIFFGDPVKALEMLDAFATTKF